MPRLKLAECFHLTENNDWEGETWHFYVPTSGNEEALAIVEEFLTRERAEAEMHRGNPSYKWERVRLHMPTLKRLGSSTGYMDEHNIIDRLDLAKVRAVNWHEMEGNPEEPVLKDPLYKGGLRGLAAP